VQRAYARRRDPHAAPVADHRDANRGPRGWAKVLLHKSTAVMQENL